MTKEVLQEKARKLGLATGGTREELYHRVEQELVARVEALDTTQIVEEVEAERALRPVPDVHIDDVMDEWHAGVVEPVSTLPAISRWEQMRAMAAVLCTSALMPRHIRNARDKEADCLVMLLAAHDLGLTSTLAFQKIHVIDGNPSLAADLMRVLMQRDGHDIKITVEKNEEGYPVSAEVLINRKEWADGDWRGAEFTMGDARDAQLLNKPNWKTFPEDMLVARATSRAARRYCSDSLGGITYTPEELGAIDAVEDAFADAAPPAPEPVPLTVEHRAQIEFAIAVLEDSQRAWLAEEWRSRLIPPLHPKRADVPPVTEDWVPTISGLLRDAAAQPVDAEIIDDGPAGVKVPSPRYSNVETVTPDPTAVGKVEALRETIEGADEVLDDSKEARAEVARRVLAEARQKAEASGVIEPLCPDCGKPMKDDNAACLTHPM